MATRQKPPARTHARALSLFQSALSWSICVRRALTTRIASDGSFPDSAASAGFSWVSVIGFSWG
jgi:hypothetical protein